MRFCGLMAITTFSFTAIFAAVLAPAQTPPEDAPDSTDHATVPEPVAELEQPAGQRTVSSPTPPTSPRTDVPPEGLWPTPKLMDLMLKRWADTLSDQYDLDPAQRKQARHVVIDRWKTFLTKNRRLIQPLVNEFVELHMELEPPEKRGVRDWAERATPVFERVREQLLRGGEDFKTLLTSAQRKQYEKDAMRFRIGLGLAGEKLKQWRTGDFQTEDFWTPPRKQRRERREQRRRARKKQSGEPVVEKVNPKEGEPNQRNTKERDTEKADQILLELQRWDEYVEDFIRRYDLDEGQRSAAASCLKELKQRAMAHRDRRRMEIADLEKRIRSNRGTEAELVRIKKNLITLYGPVDDMFRELQDRLEAIPNARQRAAAGEKTKKTNEAGSDPQTKDD